MANNPQDEIMKRMEALMHTGAAIVLELYFQEELEKRKTELLTCSKDTFEVHKGRCHELQSQLTKIKKMRENKT